MPGRPFRSLDNVLSTPHIGDRAFAVDDLRRDPARSEDRLQVYLSETTNLHVMLQDAMPRRFRDRMLSLFPVLGQRREQVEKTSFFGREICLTLAQKTIDFSDRLIVFGFGRDVFYEDYPRHQTSDKIRPLRRERNASRCDDWARYSSISFSSCRSNSC